MQVGATFIYYIRKIYHPLLEMKSAVLPYLAEYLGTFFFILVIFASNGNALAIGAALSAVIYLVSEHSGAHVNPVVSIVMNMNGSLRQGNLLYYIMAQLLGALSAFYAYKMIR
jgi:glycerol uptake facilitator-like aquaporin